MKKEIYNIGDTLLCKKDAQNILTKDYEYKIVKMNTVDFLDVCYIIIDDRTQLFPITSNMFIFAYFYSKNEYRKIKLERLNNL